MAWIGRFLQFERVGQNLPDLNFTEARAMARQAIIGLTLGLLLATTAVAKPKGTQDGQTASAHQITIRIHDYARANPLVRQHAQEVAGDILQNAGVAARWVDCPGGSPDGECSSPGPALDFVVNLLPYSMSDRLRQRGGVLGLAVEASGTDFGFFASVFYDAVKDLAAEHQQDFGELLGDAIAHELGHLLLGRQSHSNWGLMSGFWSGNYLRRASQRCLAFSDAEAKQIQAAVNARAQAATRRGRVPESSRDVPPRESFMTNVQQTAAGTE